MKMASKTTTNSCTAVGRKGANQIDVWSPARRAHLHSQVVFVSHPAYSWRGRGPLSNRCSVACRAHHSTRQLRCSLLPTTVSRHRASTERPHHKLQSPPLCANHVPNAVWLRKPPPLPAARGRRRRSCRRQSRRHKELAIFDETEPVRGSVAPGRR